MGGAESNREDRIGQMRIRFSTPCRAHFPGNFKRFRGDVDSPADRGGTCMGNGDLRYTPIRCRYPGTGLGRGLIPDQIDGLFYEDFRLRTRNQNSRLDLENQTVEFLLAGQILKRFALARRRTNLENDPARLRR